MKLINYKRGYNNTFDCSIHGTIKMNRKEFDKALSYLFANQEKLWIPELLPKDLARRIFIKNSRGIVQGFLVNIRTTATELIASRFNLKGYKKGNYQIEVDTSIENNFHYINQLTNGAY